MYPVVVCAGVFLYTDTRQRCIDNTNFWVVEMIGEPVIVIKASGRHRHSGSPNQSTKAMFTRRFRFPYFRFLSRGYAEFLKLRDMCPQGRVDVADFHDGRVQRLGR